LFFLSKLFNKRDPNILSGICRKKVTEERNCSVSVALSLISFGFLNYVIDENEEQEEFQQRLQQKRTCHKTNAPTNRHTHTEGAGGGGGEKREREWSVGTLGRLAGR